MSREALQVLVVKRLDGGVLNGPVHLALGPGMVRLGEPVLDARAPCRRGRTGAPHAVLNGRDVATWHFKLDLRSVHPVGVFRVAITREQLENKLTAL